MKNEVISKDSTIKKVKEALGVKLKNKELFDDICTLFMSVMNKGKIKSDLTDIGVEATDLTQANGEKISIVLLPNRKDYSTIKVNYIKGLRYRKSFEITYTNDFSCSVTVEESEFLVEDKLINGMKLTKSTKQYCDNKLLFVHNYDSLSVIHGISNSSDTLIQANPRGYALKRVAKVEDCENDNSCSVLYSVSREFGNETFDTFIVPYKEPTFVDCNKETYDKLMLSLKK